MTSSKRERGREGGKGREGKGGGGSEGEGGKEGGRELKKKDIHYFYSSYPVVC